MSGTRQRFGVNGHPRRSRIFTNAVFLALLAGVFLSTPAQAHERVEVGPYLIVIGWVKEPVIVGERNAILLQVTEGEAPVTGLESSLDVEVRYAGRVFLGNLSPTSESGVYNVEIFPTVRGQYELYLIGAMGEEAVDLLVEPEEVQEARVLQFPEALPDGRDLQTQIVALEGRLNTASILASAGLALGAAGLLLAGFALLRTRR